MKPGDTKRAQTALIRLGYDIGAADDDLGPRTFAGFMACVSGQPMSAVLISHARYLVSYARQFNIVGVYRLSHFIANLCHESAGFTRLSENLSYGDPARLLRVFPSRIRDIADARALIRAGPLAIGNRVYANKNGNGDEASGDGHRFKGRGWIQTTGRANYADLVSPTGLDLLKSPELLERSDVAAHAACLFWDTHKLNLKADRNDAKGVRRAINGEAMLGLNDCAQKAARLIALFHP